VRRALEAHALRQTVHAEIDRQRRDSGLAALVGESPALRAVKELARRVAESDSTSVLLLGETGTGKDLLARAIHYESARAQRPFINIMCTNMPAALVESELFGHEEGAFTDARSAKTGLLELAHRGTAFLDEIGDMPPELQAKLLRVIEDKTFHRVGGTNTIKVDCRIIAATNRHLEAMIQDGRFRKDLYYRLNTVIIRVPALRERMDDLPMLAEHFRLFFLARLGRTIEGFSPAAMDKMAHYAWPGNVRELRNVIERAILLCSSARIEAGDILLGRTLNDAGDANTCVVKLPSDGCNLAEVERDLVRQAMEMAQNNQTRAAQLLAISRDQLRYKLDKFDLPRG
jgi:transcriptional regulator with PAS, ATPase and Fis domain